MSTLSLEFKCRLQLFLHELPCYEKCVKLFAILTYFSLLFNFLQVADVTWRYSVKHKEVAQRRLLVREEWLARTLQSFNDWVSVTCVWPFMPLLSYSMVGLRKRITQQ